MLSTQNPTSPFDHLPIEVLIVMFSYLSPEQIALSARVNKQFKIAAADNFLWEEKLKKHFLHIYNKVERTNDINWYAEFCKAYEGEYRVYDKESKNYKPLPTRIKKIFSLVKEGDVASLEGVLKLNDLDQTDVNGVSLLDWAKKNNNQALLNYFYDMALKEYQLNKNTIDITKTDERKRTILHWAIHCHQPANIINLLVLQGADINVLGAGGENPLRLAAEQGQAEIVELLLDHGAVINDRSSAGATALMFAVEHGHKNVVDVLLKRNADITIPLQTSNKYHHKFKVEAGDTPLHAAIKVGRKDIVQALVNKGADINVLGAGGANPLRLAAEQGQAEIVELLLDHGAVINDRSSAGATALMFAVEHGHKNVVDVLLKRNADITIPLQTSNKYHHKFKVEAGDTPLHAASKLGSVAIVHKLLSKGANILARNNKNQTPAKVAVKNSDDTNKLKLLYYSAKTDNTGN